MAAGVARRRETVGTTLKQTALQHGRDGMRAASAHGRPQPTGGVANRHPTCGVTQMGRRWMDGRPRDSHGRTCRRRGIRPNRIKASLRAFQRWEVKVLGFGVKVRPRPQRMALRWLHVPFALVGANGKACGEAPGVSVSGTPPFLRGCLPLVLGIVIVWRVWKKRVGRCVAAAAVAAVTCAMASSGCAVGSRVPLGGVVLFWMLVAAASGSDGAVTVWMLLRSGMMRAVGWVWSGMVAVLPWSSVGVSHLRLVASIALSAMVLAVSLTVVLVSVSCVVGALATHV